MISYQNLSTELVSDARVTEHTLISKTGRTEYIDPMDIDKLSFIHTDNFRTVHIYWLRGFFSVRKDAWLCKFDYLQWIDTNDRFAQTLQSIRGVLAELHINIQTFSVFFSENIIAL